MNQYDIHLEQSLVPKPLAVVRRQVGKQELSRVVPECCGIVFNLIRSRKIAGAGRHVAVYLNSNFDVEIGVELETPLDGDDELIRSTLPTGTIATTVHYGPYQQLGQAHTAIRDWCARNGHELAGVNWELYGHWDPAWNNNPALIRTDVGYLIAP